MNVTIVIPCYNESAGNLREAVASAEAQGPGVEVVVVDDGSTDSATVTALDSLGVPVVRTANFGLPSARNTGIRSGTGRYIFPLDSDDRIDPGHVQALVRHLDEHPDTTIACTTWQEFGNRAHRIVPPQETTGVEMAERCTILAASMFRRSDWLQLGGYHDGARDAFEDWEWWVRLLLARGGVARLVAGPVLRYRIRSTSMNVDKHSGTAALTRTRQLMLAGNPDQIDVLARAFLVHDYDVAYFLGQQQSPIATEATEQARYWAGRYGRIEGVRGGLGRLAHRVLRRLPHNG
ncbi:glycosyltransferase family 2 protein [Ornithinimicrobium cryptoxanthini]|uniref:Glycosyltransferase family 2 protein n=1 Tax=Ornithinimicrobium cryptoxanthini TaxID=2934161 RepID=A0ABY4YIS6_9MICO|nr:glycosyltransferase family A protein [Ornithinimicrobium cryptoxanthini]USQ76589.1 glycosyltransferase family 2 protein [Ornithinimicrobium cryptoxanthini]